jgi:hypothetical protein
MGVPRVANLGYLGMIKQSNPNTPGIPNDYAPFYEETLSTSGNFVKQQPAAGTPYATYNVVQGQRTHGGDLTVLAEPNTSARFFDMLYPRISSQVIYTFTVTSANATVGATFTNNSQTFTVLATITAGTTLIASGTGAPAASGTLTKSAGTGDATITFSTAVAGSTAHRFAMSTTIRPNSYTIDISSGNVVSRYWGVEASKIVPDWNENDMRLKISVSALGSFQSREIATVATTTLTLTTTYSQSPNKGLVVGDLVRIYKASTGATLDTTIASVNADGVTITLGASAAAFAAGDIISLRPATPSFTLLPSFLWSNNLWFFGSTASAALALVPSAHTPVEKSSLWELMYGFEDDGGAPRSGDSDPAALIRLLADSSLSLKKIFDTPEDIINFNNLTKNAIQIRHFAGSTRQYELRVTFNHIKIDGKVVPDAKAGDVQYEELEVLTQLDQTDQQAIEVMVINGLSTI